MSSDLSRGRKRSLEAEAMHFNGLLRPNVVQRILGIDARLLRVAVQSGALKPQMVVAREGIPVIGYVEAEVLALKERMAKVGTGQHASPGLSNLGSGSEAAAEPHGPATIRDDALHAALIADLHQEDA